MECLMAYGSELSIHGRRHRIPLRLEQELQSAMSAEISLSFVT